MNGEVERQLIIGIQEDVGIDLSVAGAGLGVVTDFDGSALIAIVGSACELPEVIVGARGAVEYVDTATADELEALQELETKLDVAVDAVLLILTVVVVENPPGVLSVRGVVVVGVVVHALVILEIGIVDVRRILEDVLIDNRTASTLSCHGIADILADVVHAVVQPCQTILDLGVATEGEVVTLVVVVVSREDTVGSDVTIGNNEAGRLATTLYGNVVVKFPTGGVEVLERIGLPVEGGVGRICAIVPGGTGTPLYLTAVEEVTPGTVFGVGVVLEEVAVVAVEPALTIRPLELRDTQNLAGHDGTVVGYLYSLVLETLLGGDDDNAVCSAGTVKCGCGCALENGDALNVLGVYVCSGVTEVDSVVEVEGTACAVGDRSTVNNVERLVRTQRGITTDDNLLRSTGTARRGDLHTSDLTGKTGKSVGSMSFRDFVGTHGRGSITEGLFLAGHTGCGDNHLVKANGIFLEGDVDYSLTANLDGFVAHSEE